MIGTLKQILIGVAITLYGFINYTDDTKLQFCFWVVIIAIGALWTLQHLLSLPRPVVERKAE